MNRIYILLPFLGTIILSSCATQNLFITNEEGQASELMKMDAMDQHVIQTDDKISLSIWNHDDMSIGSIFSIYNSNEAYGKWVLVDEKGNVVLPKIGSVHLAGLTCREAADSLEMRYARDLVEPIIVVKVLNREVTVLGEVRTPGTYVLEKEKNTLTELIGRSEGFSTYADLEHIQIIRKGKSYPIDMTQLTPELQYALVVHAGDIIYVPSLNRKGLDQKAPTLIPFASTLTALAIVASIIL